MFKIYICKEFIYIPPHIPWTVLSAQLPPVGISIFNMYEIILHCFNLNF